ncbi:MAG TPA: hypothetical protein VK359_02340 [Rubrobacteraceae bacterium]|nr:hypothetical protein [Rubrobacteraceae bacterium]
MAHWLRERSGYARVSIYAAAAVLAFVLAAGLGAMGALTLRGDLGFLEREEPQPAGGQNAGQAQEEDGAAEREEATVDAQREEAAEEREGVTSQREEAAAEQEAAASQREEAEYIGAIRDIQTRSVRAFLNSHDKLLRYDALTAADVEEMQANETVLEEMNDQTGDLAPPRKYEEQYGVFSAAIDELHGATRLAYGMAADPVAAAEQGFDEYDGRVNEASDLLLSSNDLLNKEYETIEGVREVSPDF